MMQDEELGKILFSMMREEELVKFDPRLESLKSFVHKKERELTKSVRHMRESIQKGISQCLTYHFLTVEEEKLLAEKLHIPKSNKEFWRSLGEGVSLAELLEIPFEIILKIYDHALLEIDLGHSDTAQNEFYLLTMLSPLISQFWLGFGMSFYYLGEYPMAMTHFMRSIITSQNDRDMLIATLWLMDALKMVNETDRLKDVKKLALEIIDQHRELEDLRAKVLAK